MASRSDAGARSPLDAFFRLRERRARVSDEIIAGLGVCALSVCGMFVNMQLIVQRLVSGPYAEATQAQVAANGEVIAATWFVTMLVAFAASLLMGLVARLPLVQTTSLGLSSVLISLMGTATGLTYANVLLLSFVGALVYAVLMGVPAVRRVVLAAIPEPVRRALPAAAGLLIAFVALQLSGLVTVAGSEVPAYGTATVLESAPDTAALPALVGWGSLGFGSDKYHPLLLVTAVACVVALALFPVAKRRSRHPFGLILLAGTVVFLALYLGLVCYNAGTGRFSTDSLWARLWMGGGEDAMQFHLLSGAVMSNLSIGTLFSQGADFSAYVSAGGNVALLVLGSVATYVVMALSDALSTIEAVASAGACERDGADAGRALACNALANVAAPVLGVSPIAISQESVAGVEDRGRTGLTAVVAALGYLVNAFVWLVPFFMVTVTSYDVTFNMVGHYGFVMQLLAQCGFAVADVVMVLVGATMAVSALGQEWRKYSVAAAFAATVGGTLFTSNIALGLACGTIAYVLAEATRRRAAVERLGEDPSALRRIGVPTLALCALSVLILAFALV